MEGLSDGTLLQRLEKQESEITIYKQKLHDIYTAYKGQSEENAALKNVIATLKSKKVHKGITSTENIPESHEVKSGSSEIQTEKNVADLQEQINKLVNSVTAITQEKVRVEEGLKADNKKIRNEKGQIEKQYRELENLFKINNQKLDEVKTLLAKEKTERSEECQDHRARIHELQSLISIERINRKKYDKICQDISSELRNKKEELVLSEKKLSEATSELQELRRDVTILEREHQTAIQIEKERARGVEEQSKKLSAVQEERVVDLETRLAELSEAVGSYDRLRQQDQFEIDKLKNHIALLDKGVFNSTETQEVDTEKQTFQDSNAIISKILDLKSELYIISHKAGKKIDFVKLFMDNGNNIHETCTEEYNRLWKEYELYKSEMKQQLSSQLHDSSRKQISTLENQVKMLQERIKLQSDNSKDMEKELKLQVEQLKKAMRNERTRFKETLAASEMDYRGRLCLLEQQLQKQRERSLALLEEKEQEIHSLQNTFQMFLPNYRRTSESGVTQEEDQPPQSSMVPSLMEKADGPHMLHYATELARRDVDIAHLRKNKHKIESSLRDFQKAAIADTEKHREERQHLREEIARLNRCQTREGANLEYLKNVVLSFLLSDDPNSKRHMCNAIAAVLKFSDEELNNVLKHSANKWWNRSSYL